MKAALLLLCLSLSCASQARTLIACGHPFYPPVSWASDGKLVGVAAEVSEQLFSDLGYQVRLDVLGNWKRCLLELQQGNADIVVAAYRIKSRESFLSYPRQHLIADPVKVFVNRDNSFALNKLDDLKGKTVGLLLGDSFGDRLDQFFKQHNNIEYVSVGKQNFDKLALARIDYFPLGELSGRLQNRKQGYHQTIQPLDYRLTTEFYYLAVRRGSGLEKHTAWLGQQLSQLHRNGDIKRLANKYSAMYLRQLENTDGSDAPLDKTPQ